MATASSNEFQLVVPETAIRAEVHHISGFTVPCHLSPEISAVDMEIRWFKETDCVCLYKSRHMIEGRSYEGTVKQFTDVLEKGDVSISLTRFSVSDLGYYVCQVTSGGKTEEITVRVKKDQSILSSDRSSFGGFRIHIYRKNRTWTEKERLKIRDSVLMAEMSEKEKLLENTVEELETSKHQMETLRNELQDKNNQLQLLLEENKLLKSSETSVLTAPVRRPHSNEWNPPNMSGETASVKVSGSELRLVLLGSAGCEESSAGNIILNREKNQTDTSAETQQSEIRQEEVDGKQVTVVETPDWFCSGLSLEEERQDVRRSIRLSAPGPHAFLLVIPVHQSMEVNRELLEKMEEIFGERCWSNTIILFTVTDEEQEKNIEDFVQSENQEVQTLVEKCGNRFHCLNIHQSEDGSQVSELLKKIEKMMEGNIERSYSSEIYLEVESQIIAMERNIRRDREERKEREIKERIENELENSQRKIEGMIEENEGDIKQLNEPTGEQERQMREERDEEKKKELMRELEEEVQKRTELKREIDQLKDQRERERNEMEERHRQEKIRQKFGEIRFEAEKKHMKVILSKLQRNILDSRLKMQEEIIKQMEERNRESETLKKNLSELNERYLVMCEFHESALKNLKFS